MRLIADNGLITNFVSLPSAGKRTTMETPEAPCSRPEACAEAECIYCRSNLRAAATICPTCRLYQARWRNYLPVLGGVVALVALLLSGVAYLWSEVITNLK